MTTRRQFLRSGALAVAAHSVAPRLLRATPVGRYPRGGDPLLQQLARLALDAATSAGATYADVRLTLDRTQAFYYGSPPTDAESVAFGVRALVGGAWGFAASGVWTAAEATRLGRAAAGQARNNAWPGQPPVTLGARPEPAIGAWTMPVKRDPFSVTIAEKMDYIRAAQSYAGTLKHGGAGSAIIFVRQDKTFASTDGALFTQTVYNTGGHNSFFSIGVDDARRGRSASRAVPFVTPTGAGFEWFDDQRLIDRIPEFYEEARSQLNAEPATNGRGDFVFDGTAMATLVSATLGAPLELDRALGFEANASGTSYLAPPLDLLGAPFGSSLITLAADRSTAGGIATVRWDDDGVAPDAFTLVRDGVVSDYQTNREHSAALAPWYTRRGAPVRSHGCAAAYDGSGFPIIRSPNLHLAPSGNATFDALVAQIDDGYAVVGGLADMDHQALTGQGRPELMYRVKKGKIVNAVAGGAYLFRSPELWKNISAIGGSASVATRGFETMKGQPNQLGYHSVSAPAAIVKNVAIINLNPGGG